jgi:uncharacterized membrane protein
MSDQIKEVFELKSETNQKSPSGNKNADFAGQIGNAFIHFLYVYFIYTLFILPFDIWVKAVMRLALQKERGTIKFTNIDSPWPFLSFLKMYIFEFIIDGAILVVWPIGVLMAIIISGNVYENAFFAFLGVLFGFYLAPLLLILLRDILQILILPITKFIGWARKPAQHLDINMQNK